jgi:hypothetical protein
MEFERSFPCSQKPVTGFCAEPDQSSAQINHLTSNGSYRGCTAPLNYKRCILYIYSTNIGTEYFKHGIHSPFFSLFKMQFVS